MLWYAFNQNGWGEGGGREGGWGDGVVVHVVAAIEELYRVRPIVLVPLATQTIVNAAEFLSSEVFTVYPLSAASRPGWAPGGNKVLAYQLKKKI